MKRLLASFLLCVAFAASAQTVTVSITLTTAQVTRLETDLGIIRNLKDAQGNPRAATAAEVKQAVIDQLVGIVQQAELVPAQAAASAAATIPGGFTPQ